MLGAGTTSRQTGTSAPKRASLIHVTLSDLNVIDRLATRFVAQESALKDESIAYLNKQRASKRPLDPAVVHSFTMRREALANEAFARIQSEVSKEGYEGFRGYIELEFRQSIHRRK
jgi:hypothetical protein